MGTVGTSHRKCTHRSLNLTCWCTHHQGHLIKMVFSKDTNKSCQNNILDVSGPRSRNVSGASTGAYSQTSMASLRTTSGRINNNIYEKMHIKHHSIFMNTILVLDYEYHTSIG